MMYLLIGAVIMESEVIVLSEYHNIISNLIERHGFDSLFKIEITSFIIKYYKDNDLMKNYANNHVKAFLSSFLTILYSKSRDLKAINECVHILEKENYIRIKDDNVVRIKPIPYVDDTFMNKTNINETIALISGLSIDSFVEDLITYA